MSNLRAVFASCVMLAIALNGARAHADAAFLMEEPYGHFGGLSPTGHAAVYLNHICAEDPTHLRACEPGETGVVLSRYSNIDGYDWIAIPLVPYLYAVERTEDIPTTADAGIVERLRDEYRRNHLLDLAPDVSEGKKAGQAPVGAWTELIGASYDRKIYGFQIETTSLDDERFIAKFNDRRNEDHFNLFFSNCADFSRNLLNLYYPHAIHRNYFVDAGLTTPKQVARSLTNYAKHHPELEFSTFMIPQVPGTLPRSHPNNGVAEALVKTKKYVVPLAFFHPFFTAGVAVAYLANGRFHPPKDVQQVMVPGEVEISTAP